MKRVQLSCRFGVACFAAGLVVTGAGCGGHGANGKEGTSIVGWAIAGHPLVGADVRIVDAQGHELARAIEPTLKRGFFAARLKDPPAKFTVIATGGTDGGNPFTGELRGEVVGTHLHPVVLNPATTLASELARSQHVSLHEAVASVQKYLGLPRAVADLEGDLRVNDRWFSSSAFERQAATHGGHDAYVRQLASEIDGKHTRAFPAAPTNGIVAAGAEDAIDDVLGSLGKGAVSGVASFAMGQVLSALIGGGSSNSAALATISDQLTAIAAAIQNVNNGINNLNLEIDKLQYGVDVSNIAEFVSAVAVPQLWSSYQGVVDGGDGTQATTDAAIAAFEQNLALTASSITSNKGVAALNDGLKAINDRMQASQTLTSALADWSTYFATGHRYWTADTQSAYRFPFDYWAAIEAELVVMIEEYANANAPGAVPPALPSTNFTPDIATAPAFVQWQQDGNLSGMQPIPAGVIVDAGSHTVWPQNFGVLSATNSSWPTAVDLTGAAQLAQALPTAFSFHMPSNSEFVNLVSAAGSYQSSWSSPPQPNIAVYLASVGFANVPEYWWVSDVINHGGWNAATLHQAFSMQNGSLHFECASALPNTTNTWTYNCPSEIAADDPNVWTTAVAQIAETPTSWYASPPSG